MRNVKAKSYFNNRKKNIKVVEKPKEERYNAKISSDGNSIIIKIEKLDNDMTGISHAFGKTVFCFGALNDEEVEAEITEQTEREIYCKAVKIITPSPDRAEVLCPYFGMCGNCNILDMNYEAQLIEKSKLVKRKLFNVENINVEPCIGGEPFAYRNKLHLVFNEDRNKLTLGFFDEETHKVVEVKKCLLHGDWFVKVSKIILQWAREHNFHAYKPWAGKGLLRFAVVRKIGDEIMVTLVATNGRISGMNGLLKQLQEEFKNVSLYVNVNNGRSSEVFGEKFMFVGGNEKLSGEICGVKYELGPNSFFQINEGITEKIYGKVSEIIKDSDAGTVIDCFSGIGITSALFAKAGKKVVSVEIVGKAVEDAKKLAEINGVKDKITALCGDAEKVLPKIRYEGETVFFIDPPRRGLGEKVCASVVKFAPREIIYLSCNPETLAYDLEVFTKNGYAVNLVQPYDMFPQTKHVETLVLMTRRGQNK